MPNLVIARRLGIACELYCFYALATLFSAASLPAEEHLRLLDIFLFERSPKVPRATRRKRLEGDTQYIEKVLRMRETAGTTEPSKFLTAARCWFVPPSRSGVRRTRR